MHEATWKRKIGYRPQVSLFVRELPDDVPSKEMSQTSTFIIFINNGRIDATHPSIEAH